MKGKNPQISISKLNRNRIEHIFLNTYQKNSNYFRKKDGKPYAKTTLISYIKKFNNDNKKEEIKKEEIKEEIKYKNEIIWTLSEEDKKNNDEYNEIEAILISCIKSCHDILYSN